MTIDQYLQAIQREVKLGNSTEHTFRGYLKSLIETLVPGVLATNEPKRQQAGAPDYILTRREVPLGYIEAKDLGDTDLLGEKKTGNKEQFDRYKLNLGENIIFTDYLDFIYFKNREKVMHVRIGVQDGTKILPLPHQFEDFQRMIREFTTHIAQTIKSPKKLAEMMAAKARLLSEVIEKSLNSDEEEQQNSTLKDQMRAFKEILIHDITAKGFADVYAQTIAYGLFAARLHDPTLPTFSRQEAAELIPKSNPFLRKLFGYIAGPDLDDRIKWIVDSLVEIFLACNVEEILSNYGKQTKMEDPIIHFYETFLSEYDPSLRKARGVWYTPQPVVDFIVRSVDEILKTEFGLDGLADTSKTTIKVPVQTHDKRFAGGMREVDQEIHKVQILDPATGTGTFLAEVVKHIHKKFQGQQGVWSNYVEKHLIPRLNGFELLMASYAMAHLKLDLLLKDTGYSPPAGEAGGGQRLRVYLTNSLEQASSEVPNLFMAQWLTDEAAQADVIKRDKPIMVVIGNPPYSGESANKGDWIMNLMEDYKKEPGGREKLKERNPKWINDDYVKFIRYGQHFIEKNGSGILAYINPHGFLDNPTFRGMRWNLLKTFDKIYTIDLHGNSNKKETSPDGSKDENVFDIKQGVSINVFIKNGKKGKDDLAKVYHKDVYGKRDDKYKFLVDSNFSEINFNQINSIGPLFSFIERDQEKEKTYNLGIVIDKLFNVSTVGIVTSRDSFVISENRERLENNIKDFFILDKNELIKKYKLKENSTWKINQVKEKAKTFNSSQIQKISYRPFDTKYIYFDPDFLERSRKEIMSNFLNNGNVGLITARSNKSETCDHFYITKDMMETKCGERTTQSAVFPLYLYPESTGQLSLGSTQTRTPNLNLEIVNQIAKGLGLVFKSEKTEADESFAPIDLLDYIYAVLHSPSYRETYKEFLKIDFPRVPYPTDVGQFWKLVALGGELRQLHLMESPALNQLITQYPIAGENEVEKIAFVIASDTTSLRGGTTKQSPEDETASEKSLAVTGRVYINSEQYFDSVSEVAWNFYIGGYQPAQKWLKDRKGRVLDFEDIMHYQKIIKALSETARVMGEIDDIKL